MNILGGGCDESMGSIPAGATAQQSFWIQQDGELKIHFESGKDSKIQVIDEYVTNNIGGDTTVTVNPDDTTSVRNRFD